MRIYKGKEVYVKKGMKMALCMLFPDLKDIINNSDFVDYLYATKDNK